jgi:hypothetical protein
VVTVVDDQLADSFVPEKEERRQLLVLYDFCPIAFYVAVACPSSDSIEARKTSFAGHPDISTLSNSTAPFVAAYFPRVRLR